MKTPICDFARAYAQKDALRLHTPGHKGQGALGPEPLDITEFTGADDLHHPTGIIRESEENAASLFGCPTVYSAEGSSQCIRAMVYLAMLHAKKLGKAPLIAAGRNAHRTFLSAVALLDVPVRWLYPEENASFLACPITPSQLEKLFCQAGEKPGAVYVTSPDYLGHMADVRGLSDVCHRHGALLLVDNAHGAYLRFLPESRFPMDLGADLCCSSAHKTLPVLTGGAYLHLSEKLQKSLSHQVKPAMALFGSTSPSYLILQSLDAANAYLAGCKSAFADFSVAVESLKKRLEAHGCCLIGTEPLKLTLYAKPRGYTGEELGAYLESRQITCEFYDPDYVVLMLSPQIGTAGLSRLEAALTELPARPPISTAPPVLYPPEQVCSPREATLALSKAVPVAESLGCVLADPGIGCPPAVPIVVCGERIDEHAIRCFQYYGIEDCAVMV